MKTPVLGVIGGMGPLAATVFCEKVVLNTKAGRDQDHIETILWNKPDIPPRVEYILDHKGEDPGPALADIAKKLEYMGADVLAMPCVTAHFFYREIQDQIQIPLLNIIEETAHFLQQRGIRRVGILATEGTARAGVLAAELARCRIESCFPKAELQNIVTDVIFQQVKQGKPVQTDVLQPVIDDLVSGGAEKVLLACTELSVVNHRKPISRNCLDMLDIYALAAVTFTKMPV